MQWHEGLSWIHHPVTNALRLFFFPVLLAIVYSPGFHPSLLPIIFFVLLHQTVASTGLLVELLYLSWRSLHLHFKSHFFKVIFINLVQVLHDPVRQLDDLACKNNDEFVPWL
ncbi:hypothetical protein Tco_0600507 [Tanacetum coccineum]|uniref:Uncharacterized protein n=1 Tax=Tanacetum coccineum TaxID=301880 RepID=A0ABQ4WBY0_9ASTR